MHVCSLFVCIFDHNGLKWQKSVKGSNCFTFKRGICMCVLLFLVYGKYTPFIDIHYLDQEHTEKKTPLSQLNMTLIGAGWYWNIYLLRSFNCYLLSRYLWPEIVFVVSWILPQFQFNFMKWFYVSKRFIHR